jgi:two-component system sensor histidine kinase MprB
VRLRTRMAFISAAAVAVVVVVAVVLAQQVARRELMAEIDDSLVERVQAIERFPVAARDIYGSGSTADAERAYRRFGPQALLGRDERGFDALFIQLLAPGGEVLIPDGQPVALPVSDDDRALVGARAPHLMRTEVVGDDRIRMITAPLGVGAIQVGRSLAEVDETLARVTGTLTLAGAIGVALAGVLGLVVARSALRPVDELTETMEHVTETMELAKRIDIERDDEVGRLARSFNELLEALEESRIQQRRLVRDAGHELRTPLTALRTNLELLARAESLTDEQRRELLDAATFELRELSDLTAELVALAADPAAATEVRESRQMAELVDRVVERFRRRTGREIGFVATPFEAIVAPMAMERAVANLVDNALKWGPAGTPIEVTVGGGRIAVADHGPGIDEADRPRVFDRFYRADAARSTPGSGLGLAIVEKIVDDHDGTVFVEETAGGGATVGFRIPVAG